MKYIGKGAYSNVWLAYSLKLNKFVGIKAIDHSDEDTADRELEFNKKIIKANKLKIILDWFSDATNTYMVFNLYGGSLYELYKYNKLNDEQLTKIFNKAVEKISYLHKKFKHIHGDIKPESFMYYGTNPICKDFIDRFNNLGGIKTFLDKTNGNIDKAIKLLKEELFTDEDYNSDLFSVYNSSNEKSDEDSEHETDEDSEHETDEDSEHETDEDSEHETESNKEQELNSNEEQELNSNEESDDNSSISSFSSSFSSESSIEGIILDYTLTQEQLDNLEIDLIDYSHVHELKDDLHFEPTRYYRCIETLQNEECGYWKDWYALACMMYELEHRELFVNPSSDDKDTEQIEFIKENFYKLKKWLKN